MDKTSAGAIRSERKGSVARKSDQVNVGSDGWGPARLVGVMAAVALLLSLVTGCGSDNRRIEGIQRDKPLQVEGVTLLDVAGAHPQPFAMRAQPQRLLVVYFGYTSCPDLCPTTMADVRSALERLGKRADRVEVAMVTVDPKRDTAEVMRAYLSHFFSRFHALRTEDAQGLQRAQDAFLASSSITPRPDGGYDVAHSSITYVVDQRGRVVVEWPFGTKPPTLAKDLGILLEQTEAEETRA